jgi:hypothetical protein
MPALGQLLLPWREVVQMVRLGISSIFFLEKHSSYELRFGLRYPELCELGQVAELLCASISSSA